jgi:hypothetical protein
MKNAKYSMSPDNATALARSSAEQLEIRAERYLGRLISGRVNETALQQFFMYGLSLPIEPDCSIVRPIDLFNKEPEPQDNSFFAGILRAVKTEYEGNTRTKKVSYPRALILTREIEEDIRGRRPPKMGLKSAMVSTNRVIGPIFTGHKHGMHAFSTAQSYYNLLGHKNGKEETDVANILLANAKNNSYFALFRLDKSTYSEKTTAENPGWLEKPKLLGVTSVPLLIVPGIKPEDLEKLIEIEKAALGL